MAYLLPGLLAALALPLALGRVRRNRIYGFRTCRTLSSDSVWYPANRFAGLCLLAAAAVAAAVNSAILAGGVPAARAHSLMAVSLIAAVLAATLLSLLKLRKL